MNFAEFRPTIDIIPRISTATAVDSTPGSVFHVALAVDVRLRACQPAASLCAVLLLVDSDHDRHSALVVRTAHLLPRPPPTTPTAAASAGRHLHQSVPAHDHRRADHCCPTWNWNCRGFHQTNYGISFFFHFEEKLNRCEFYDEKYRTFSPQTTLFVSNWSNVFLRAFFPLIDPVSSIIFSWATWSEAVVCSIRTPAGVSRKRPKQLRNCWQLHRQDKFLSKALCPHPNCISSNSNSSRRHSNCLSKRPLHLRSLLSSQSTPTISQVPLFPRCRLPPCSLSLRLSSRRYENFIYSLLA